MKISLNWLNTYTGVELKAEEVADILTGTGLEVEAIEAHDVIKGGLRGLVVGEVMSKAKHPNADKLNLTEVNIGAGPYLKIVCGAPNVEAGQKVVVATVGTTIHPTEGEPFTIKRAKIRGEESEGMLCAEDEIGLGSDHGGIMVLDPKAKIGTPVAKLLGIQSDSILEVAITPNRTDAISHIGVARDLCAVLRIPVQHPIELRRIVGVGELPLKVELDKDGLCGRYSSVILQNVKVGPSPEWLRSRLESIGVKSINNVVDVTNFVMHEMGQPMHAFDYDKTGGEIEIKKARKGQKFTALDGNTYTLQGGELMVANQDNLLAMAGVIGGKEHSISDSTKNILLESAWFNAGAVRLSAKKHGIRTDSSYRFERGTDPNAPMHALKRAVQLIQEVAGGQGGCEPIDIYPKPVEAPKIHLSLHHLERFLGFAVKKETVVEVLQALDIRIIHDFSDVLEVEVPTYRTDVTREIDVVEEFLRIYGFENIPSTGVIAFGDTFPRKTKSHRLKVLISHQLASAGYNEIMNNSLTSTEALGFIDLPEDEVVKIMNPLSEDLSILRNNLLYGGLKTIAYNLNRQQTNLKLFEFGTSHTVQDGKFKETELLGIWLSGMNFENNWYEKSRKTDFYQLNAQVQNVLKRMNITPTEITDFHNRIFTSGLKYKYKNRVICEMGKVHQQLLKKIDIKQEVFYARINWEVVRDISNKNGIVFKEPSKFPAIQRDLALVIDRTVMLKDLMATVKMVQSPILENVSVFDVYEGKNLGEGKKSYGLTFNFRLQDRTLKNEEVDQVMQKLIANFEQNNGAVIRQ